MARIPMNVKSVGRPSRELQTLSYMRECIIEGSLIYVIRVGRYLIKALTTHHRIDTGGKPYECFEYGQTFSQSSYLVTHQQIHAGEKPFKCNECVKAFQQHSGLPEHQRLHSGEKHHACCECGKSFSGYTAFLKHQRLHTGKKET